MMRATQEDHVMGMLATIADGPAVVDTVSRNIRMHAMELGFGLIVEAMHFSMCRDLASLDVLVQELDSQLRGYMVCLSLQSGAAHRRRSCRELQAAIGNYKQGRANGVRAREATYLRSV